ncbi:MAG: NADH pyrophosphatase [Chlamydiae bacterium]|nr:NADH pyrophosphatase [Chlamydiota bacterium]
MKSIIQPPFAAPEEFVMALKPEGRGCERWVIFSENKLLIHSTDKTLPDRCPFALESNLYIGMYEGNHLFTSRIKEPKTAPSGWEWSDLRQLHGLMDDRSFALSGRALQLINWQQKNTYCGSCGEKMTHREHERCLECLACGHLSYPNLSPVTMALVRREDKILLARSPHFPDNMYSVLAGYVDPGETLEQCVAREVFEEVGLRVKNIRYFGSQPWPFSHSLLMAFCCDWEAGEIEIDPTEIEDANWYEKGNLPEIPSPLSIARLLIDSF